MHHWETWGIQWMAPKRSPNMSATKEEEKRTACCWQCGFMPRTWFPLVTKLNTFFALGCFVYPSDIFCSRLFFFCPIYLLCAHSNKASKSLAQVACSCLLLIQTPAPLAEADAGSLLFSSWRTTLWVLLICWCPFELARALFIRIINPSEVRDYGCLSVYEDQGD